MTNDKFNKAIELNEKLNELKIELEAISNGDIEELSFYFKQSDYLTSRPMVVKVREDICRPHQLRLTYEKLLRERVNAMQKEFDEL